MQSVAVRSGVGTRVLWDGREVGIYVDRTVRVRWVIKCARRMKRKKGL